MAFQGREPDKHGQPTRYEFPHAGHRLNFERGSLNDRLRWLDGARSNVADSIGITPGSNYHQYAYPELASRRQKLVDDLSIGLGKGPQYGPSVPSRMEELFPPEEVAQGLQGNPLQPVPDAALVQEYVRNTAQAALTRLESDRAFNRGFFKPEQLPLSRRYQNTYNPGGWQNTRYRPRSPSRETQPRARQRERSPE